MFVSVVMSLGQVWSLAASLAWVMSLRAFQTCGRGQHVGVGELQLCVSWPFQSAFPVCNSRSSPWYLLDAGAWRAVLRAAKREWPN